ncbi:EpsG family protein [Flavobacterium sp. K5-23]|uniref:EpsG family protein n=1 Tax=Flavobacterium sp. K5-23 TaxID=2746225 RepID=UPI00201013BA|nr:EpsG family protein [Flavobacterium sp. K5-23]UQD56124.1 EpsG family protein [Flavobacterium sp. K5-23]
MRYVFSFVDLWPYLLIAVVFFICLFLKSKHNSVIIYLTLFIFCALRYDVGWDYMSYISDLESGYEEILDSRYELFSKGIFLIGSYLNFYPIVFIIFAYLTLKIVYDSINLYSINPLLSWVVYYSMPLFFFSALSTIRQSLATVIVFYSYRFVKEKKYVYFLLTILIGSLFHVSAVIGILILPLVMFPISKTKNIILFILSFFISTIIYNYLINLNAGISSLTRLQSYILNDENVKPNKIIYLYYAIGVFNLLFFDKLISYNNRNKDFITLFNFGLIMLNLLSFEPISSLRISAFFMLYIIYLIPYYVKFFTAKDHLIVQFSITGGFLALSFFYIYLYVNSYNEFVLAKVSFLPYKFWFFE